VLFTLVASKRPIEARRIFSRETVRGQSPDKGAQSPRYIKRFTMEGFARVLRRAPWLVLILASPLLLSDAKAYKDTEQIVIPAVPPISYDGRAIEARHVQQSLSCMWYALGFTNAQYVPILCKASRAFRVPYLLLVSLIDQETGGTWRASIVVKEPDGTFSYGLSMANGRYLAYYSWKFGLHDPLDPEQAIWFAAQYLAFLRAHGEGDWFNANIDYKQGLNNKVPTEETRRAVEQVCRNGGVIR
jgi:hypothetical protein